MVTNSFDRFDAAVFRKDYRALDQLLRSEDIDSRDEDGRTPLMYAILAEDADPVMIEYLIQQGANVTTTEQQGWTPLHFAARDQKFEIVKILVDHGAPVDAVDVFGNTPLWRCIMSTFPMNLAVVDLLLEHGADPGRKNNHGVSPLDVAQTMGKLELVERLARSAK
jgi:ankyrin repeat protein